MPPRRTQQSRHPLEQLPGHPWQIQPLPGAPLPEIPMQALHGQDVCCKTEAMQEMHWVEQGQLTPIGFEGKVANLKNSFLKGFLRRKRVNFSALGMH